MREDWTSEEDTVEMQRHQEANCPVNFSLRYSPNKHVDACGFHGTTGEGSERWMIVIVIEIVIFPTWCPSTKRPSSISGGRWEEGVSRALTEQVAHWRYCQHLFYCRHYSPTFPIHIPWWNFSFLLASNQPFRNFSLASPLICFS